MRTSAQQYLDYNVVIDMAYRLSEKDRIRLIDDLSCLTGKKADSALFTRIEQSEREIHDGNSTLCHTHKEVLEHLNSL